MAYNGPLRRSWDHRFDGVPPGSGPHTTWGSIWRSTVCATLARRPPSTALVAPHPYLGPEVDIRPGTPLPLPYDEI